MSSENVINSILKGKIHDIFNALDDKNQALSEIFNFLIDSGVLNDDNMQKVKAIFDYLVELGYSQDVLMEKYIQSRSIKQDDRHSSNFAFMEGENKEVKIAPSFDDDGPSLN